MYTSTLTRAHIYVYPLHARVSCCAQRVTNFCIVPLYLRVEGGFSPFSSFVAVLPSISGVRDACIMSAKHETATLLSGLRRSRVLLKIYTRPLPNFFLTDTNMYLRRGRSRAFILIICRCGFTRERACERQMSNTFHSYIMSHVEKIRIF